MIRTILWFVYFWFLLLQLIPKMRLGQQLLDRGDTEGLASLVEKVVPTWANRLLRAAGVEVEVVGRENIPLDPALFVSNHQGNFDIPLLLANLGKPKGIIAKISLSKMPFINRWMHYFGCVFLDRDDARQSLRVLSEAEKRLEDGQSMIIFPEGTRSKSNIVGEFKPGALKLALKSGTPIVPVVIDGTWRIMERQKYFIKPGKVRLSILPPVQTAGLSREEQKQLSEQIRTLIFHVLEESLPASPSTSTKAATGESASS